MDAQTTLVVGGLKNIFTNFGSSISPVWGSVYVAVY
jgi:hypothetical protein